jgi:hypothetical protein
VTEPSSTPPLRTWRPMAFWTAALLLALGLIWFVAAVVVPVWQVRAIVKPYVDDRGDGAATAWILNHYGAIHELGGPVEARRKLTVYLHAPSALAPGKLTATQLLQYCGEPAREKGDSPEPETKVKDDAANGGK